MGRVRDAMALGTSKIFGTVRWVAAMLAVLLLTASWVFYADDRLPSHSARIGTLSVELPEGSGTGTAFLIDECGILTNFHVVFGPWHVTALRPPSHDFTGTFTLTEVTLPDGTHPTTRAIPVVWGNYLGPDRQWRRPEEDWTYLVLEECFGLEHGYFDVREADLYEPPVDTGFTATGYSAGRQMADPTCAARADPTAVTKGWLHDCAALAGDSGGPIFRAGTLTVVALASGHRAQSSGRACLSAGSTDEWFASWGSGCANVAVPVSSVMRARLWEAGAAFGIQSMLAKLGYSVGPIGTIGAPQTVAAIRQVQREMGWSETGEPSEGLYKVLQLRIAAVR
jgi:Putative peptidoglycan binding domain